MTSIKDGPDLIRYSHGAPEFIDQARLDRSAILDPAFDEEGDKDPDAKDKDQVEHLIDLQLWVPTDEGYVIPDVTNNTAYHECHKEGDYP
ncbi:MAG: hypothetical protein IPN62_02495 [Flavobacteriales bacterium]|nr:hypothetical protein [Flavobacteriales bacterium]